jgi:hypothetical protein
MSGAGQRLRCAPSRAVFAYAGAAMLGQVARTHGQGRVAALAAELGAHLWPRLDVPTAADALPVGVVRPFRRALAAWPAGIDGARACLADQVEELGQPLADAMATLHAAPHVPSRQAGEAALAVARVRDVPDAWARWQFEARELATLGMVTWAAAIVPRMDAETEAAAWARVAVAAALVALAGIADDAADGAGVQLLHDALDELAAIVPAALWPSFDDAGEHHTAPVMGAGHG